MGIIRDSFVMFKNWAEAINALPEDYQLESYKALASYGISGEIPEGISAVAKAMLISFSTGMENSILRYNASVENGKKGGRPRKEETQENLEKPSETQENLEEPKNDLGSVRLKNKNLNVNDNVNDISKSINNKNINIFNVHACAKEIEPKSAEQRSYWKEKFKDFWFYGLTASREKLAFEVIDVILEADDQAKSKEGLVFNKQKYKGKQFFELADKLIEEDLRKIVWMITDNDEIENRPYYILGAIINRAAER